MALLCLKSLAEIQDCQWSVTRQANGLYTIQTSGKTTTYMACAHTTHFIGDNVTGLSAPFEWDLRTFGGGLVWSLVATHSHLEAKVR